MKRRGEHERELSEDARDILKQIWRLYRILEKRTAPKHHEERKVLMRTIRRLRDRFIELTEGPDAAK